MPNGYRVRQVNCLENAGSPAVRTFLPLQRSGQGPACARERRFAARRNCYLLPQSAETNIDATGIPQYGLEWTAREEHV
jgi:hypothetical protein